MKAVNLFVPPLQGRKKEGYRLYYRTPDRWVLTNTWGHPCAIAGDFTDLEESLRAYLHFNGTAQTLKEADVLTFRYLKRLREEISGAIASSAGGHIDTEGLPASIRELLKEV